MITLSNGLSMLGDVIYSDDRCNVVALAKSDHDRGILEIECNEDKIRQSVIIDNKATRVYSTLYMKRLSAIDGKP